MDPSGKKVSLCDIYIFLFNLFFFIFPLYSKGIFMWYFNYHYEKYFIHVSLLYLISLLVLPVPSALEPFQLTSAMTHGLWQFLPLLDKVVQAHLIHFFSLTPYWSFLQGAQVPFSRTWSLEATETHVSVFSVLRVGHCTFHLFKIKHIMNIYRYIQFRTVKLSPNPIGFVRFPFFHAGIALSHSRHVTVL